MRHVTTLAFAAILAGSACSEQNFVMVPDQARIGELQLTGRVCDPEAKRWLAGAVVYTHLVDRYGELFNTLTATTDSEGRWTLDGLAGDQQYTIYIQYGSSLVDKYEIDMPSDDYAVPDPDCSNPSSLEVAVITGDYDDFEAVLGAVGIGVYDLINGKTGANLEQFLSNPAALERYDAIFFPGGSIEEGVIYDSTGSNASEVAAVQDTLLTYVDGGGVLYVSDWSYDVVEILWPDRIEFLLDDAVPNAAEVGTEFSVDAAITDESMASSVGADTVEITYDLDQWPVIEGVPGGTRVYMRGDIEYRVGMESYSRSSSPLMVSFPHGEGKVIFSTWRQASNLEGDSLKVIRHILDGIE